MAEWRLIDGRNPADSPQDFPAKLISSEAELREELDRLRQLEPGIVSLNSPTGGALQIGIGGPFAGLRWYKKLQSDAPSEVLADRPYCSSRIDFLAEDDAIAFWPEHLMPVDQVIESVVYFFGHQRLPDWVAWKEWDHSQLNWHVKSAIKIKSA